MVPSHNVQYSKMFGRRVMNTTLASTGSQSKMGLSRHEVAMGTFESNQETFPLNGSICIPY